MNNIVKRTSLLRFGNNYGRKKFLQTLIEQNNYCTKLPLTSVQTFIRLVSALS